MGFIDDVNLVPRRRRGKHRALAQITGVVDTTVAGRIKFNHIKGTRAIGREVSATLADPAWVRGWALLAVKGAGQDACG